MTTSLIDVCYKSDKTLTNIRKMQKILQENEYNVEY